VPSRQSLALGDELVARQKKAGWIFETRASAVVKRLHDRFMDRQRFSGLLMSCWPSAEKRRPERP